jgi:hypothetical protein
LHYSHTAANCPFICPTIQTPLSSPLLYTRVDRGEGKPRAKVTWNPEGRNEAMTIDKYSHSGTKDNLRVVVYRGFEYMHIELALSF